MFTYTMACVWSQRMTWSDIGFLLPPWIPKVIVLSCRHHCLLSHLASLVFCCFRGSLLLVFNTNASFTFSFSFQKINQAFSVCFMACFSGALYFMALLVAERILSVSDLQLCHFPSAVDFFVVERRSVLAAMLFNMCFPTYSPCLTDSLVFPSHDIIGWAKEKQWQYFPKMQMLESLRAIVLCS